MPFILFACLITLTRPSRTMLNRCGKRRHSLLVHHLRGKKKSPLSIKYDISSMFSINAHYQVS